MKLYVESLEALFAGIGPVTSANVITDRETGRSRGFGFVEMDRADAQRAMQELNGHEVDSRALKVNEANDKPRRSNF